MIYNLETISAEKKYIQRCLDLALLGKGNVAPNPMVGSVIVHHNKIIGEGYHMQFGGPHAEVNAINSVKDPSLLKHSTIYVSLEPCSHFGKTPPCADLIIKSQIPHVVIATLDSNSIVCGNGVKKLKAAGIKVNIGILEDQAKALNSAFNTYQHKNRPQILLKWAESADGFIDGTRNSSHTKAAQISNPISSIWVHKMRSEVDAILIGRNTLNVDNPSLTTRKWYGKNPLRIIIDPNLNARTGQKIFQDGGKNLVFNLKENKIQGNTEWIKLPTNDDFLEGLLSVLHQRKILSVLVEGGAHTTQSFIDQGLFDKCIVIKSSNQLKQGVKAPKLEFKDFNTLKIYNDQLYYYG